MPHARVQMVAEGGLGGSVLVQVAAAMVVREAVRLCGRQCSGVRWSKLMVEVECGGWSRRWRRRACIYVWAPRRGLVQTAVLRPQIR
jgi:hypothetical protein